MICIEIRFAISPCLRQGLLFYALICSLSLYLPAVDAKQSQAEESQYDAAFERWESIGSRLKEPIFRDHVKAKWIDEAKGQFFYRIETGEDETRFVFVDAQSRSRTEFENFEQMTQAIRSELPEFAATQKLDSLTPNTRIRRSQNGGDRTDIRFQNDTDRTLIYKWINSEGRFVDYGKVDPQKSVSISTFEGHAWALQNEAGETIAAFVADVSQPLAIINSDTPIPMQENRSRGRRANRASSPRHRSPNALWRVNYEDNNMVLVDENSGERTILTTDGTTDCVYSGNVWWSPNSKHFVVMKTERVETRKIPIVESSPDGSIHSKLMMVDYAKPGDPRDHPRPVLFDVENRTPKLIEDSLFPNPFSIDNLRWHQDGTSFSFVYNQRGHQALRVIAVDAETAIPRAMIDEQSNTFVCYSHKQFLRRLDKTNEAIWMSERSGWNHLYLVDQKTGQTINAITSGNWVVRSVERVEEEKRQIWLVVSGIDPDQDPYYRHLVRVNFDGTDVVRLTSGDGDHSWEFTSGNRYLIDTYSRVDLPPVTTLRDADTGKEICQLETADASKVLQTGWQYPERFVAKGRDGETDIYGIIIRPTNFDPSKRYPVMESIYAGPQAAFVPKSFGRQTGMQKMAELGFIIVKIDGMGTSYRSKAFHDVCWQNLGDSGFPDRIAWIQAAAKEYPEMDLSRIGIWGGSAGGQSALRALIDHGDFYRAAAADCGCHDNRVDKMWWNEQWMGYPVGPHYEQESNVTQVHKMQGDLMLIGGELDTNVDPASTMQVVNGLVKANKDFEFLLMPGVGHGAAGHPYAQRRQADFFVRKLLGLAR
ncbi:Prolyl tripeptidyl peptidase precursor [Planctomycetes bacterium CA13]|uniref:Prolyl tripeptidyl peptidase n=1 Tax=Novipirellula herctigrandis TaxID=2527986 RepID=A0A5C5YWZ5_9BACT|nr:Prolyl tripeptidyl peptidase precursor [Planctomycetes bacterium CA13]